MSLRFGTDGVRGLANVELTPELALALGRAAARVLGADRPFVLARDTRRSGPMLEAALTAGLAAEGADVFVAGVMPTPGAAYLSQSRDCPAAVLSASHNPFPDNGIKFFARGGRKLTDDVEEHFEAELDDILAGRAEPRRVEGAAVGRADPDESALRNYEHHLLTTLEGRRLDGLLSRRGPSETTIRDFVQRVELEALAIGFVLSVLFLLVFYLQGARGFDPVMAGVLLAPLAVGMLVLSPVSGVLADRYGSRVLATAGMMVTGIGPLRNQCVAIWSMCEPGEIWKLEKSGPRKFIRL